LTIFLADKQEHLRMCLREKAEGRCLHKLKHIYGHMQLKLNGDTKIKVDKSGCDYRGEKWFLDIPHLLAKKSYLKT
jgi:hypothetical protein